jgi:hypothetical protein
MTITATATSQDCTLELSYAPYSTNHSLQSIILSVVDAIIEQDSTDRGVWTYVITKRISLNGFYSEHEVRREIGRMMKAGTLYESCLEIRDGYFFMKYVRNGNEILGME